MSGAGKTLPMLVGGHRPCGLGHLLQLDRYQCNPSSRDYQLCDCGQATTSLSETGIPPL